MNTGAPEPAVPAGSRRAAREAAAAKLAAAVLATATVPFDTRSLIPAAADAAGAVPVPASGDLSAFFLAEDATRSAPFRAASPVEAVSAEAVSPVEAVSAEAVSAAFLAESEPAGDASRAAHADLFTAPTRLVEAPPAAALPRVAEAGIGAASPAHTAPRRSAFRRFAAMGATAGVMGVVGLLAVSMTLPTEAVAAATGAQPSSAMAFIPKTASSSAVEIADDEIQAFVAPANVANDPLQRSESFSSVSLVELAGELGIRYSNSLYTNDPSAAIQWPFAVGVAMSSPYGMRDGTMHEGIDLVPGEGAPIQAIADGTVRLATESGGNYGVTVYIDHIIDGQLITSHYSHMQYGSLQVQTGQQVTVGTILGKTGNTGRSYGAHLHFEIIINGATIDPLPWMQEHAGRH